MYKCKFCETDLPPKRVQLGYLDTCTRHSTATRYFGFNVVSGKDTREVQVIKNPETYQAISRLDRTKGRR